MKLSILDQSPILVGKTSKDALEESVQLAKLGEELGYHRYWIAEHHDLKGLACPAPEVMLGIIGTQTNKIRIGAGAILLPHYKPYKVAETFNVLATLFPNRIDLGLGRSPGGSAEASMALSDNFLENVKNMPEKIDELNNFLTLDFSEEHIFSKVEPSPVPNVSPVPWLLGTSRKSAILAAEKGIPYTFGHFMSDANGPDIVHTYRKQWRQQRELIEAPKVFVAISAFCAETKEKAEQLAMSSLISLIKANKGNDVGLLAPTELSSIQLDVQEKKLLAKMKAKLVIGNPREVKEQLERLQKIYDVDELMILTNTYSYEARRESYRLIANQLL